MGAWMVAAAAVSAYAGYASQEEASKGKGAQPMYTAANMPKDLLQRYQTAQNQMPVTGNVGFGDQQYPTFYGPNARMTQMLYQPQGALPGTQQGSPWGAAAQAALPYVSAWAQQNQNQNQNQNQRPGQAPANNQWV